MTTAHTMSAVGWLNGQTRSKAEFQVGLAEPHALENVQLRTRIEKQCSRVAVAYRTEVKITQVPDGKQGDSRCFGNLDGLCWDGGFV